MGFSSHLFLKVGTVGTRWDSKFVGKMVVGCFNTLAMGTSFAVEVAQHSHTTLLQREGCLIPTEQVKYRSPLPRGPVH